MLIRLQQQIGFFTAVFLISSGAFAAVHDDQPRFDADMMFNGKDLHVLLDLTESFRLKYTGNDGKVQTNSAFKLPNDTSFMAMQVKNSSDAQLKFLFDDSNSTLVLNLAMQNGHSVFKSASLQVSTKGNGFKNAKSALMKYDFPITANNKWSSEDQFECNAGVSAESAHNEFRFAAFRLLISTHQAWGGNVSHCAADMSTTTMKPTPTTTTPPAPEDFFRVPASEPCILLNTSLRFELTYNMIDNKTRTVSFDLPKNALAKGFCGTENGTEQALILSWPVDREEWMLTMNISDTKVLAGSASDGAGYAVYKMTIEGVLGQALFPNASETSFKLMNKVNTTNGAGKLDNFFAGSKDMSITCGEYKRELGDVAKDHIQIKMDFKDTQFQAFVTNSSATTPFSKAHTCATGMPTSELIPIIVGSCLAALICIVLVAYLIGRARYRRGVPYEGLNE